MARWSFDAVPVGLAALVVICVAGKEIHHQNRISAIQHDRGAYFLDLAMSNQRRRVRYLCGADVGLWFGIIVQIGSVLYS